MAVPAPSETQVEHDWGYDTANQLPELCRLSCRLSLSIVAAALLASQPASAQRYADLESCELAAGGGRLTVTARCGTLEVAENPDDPDTRRIELSYAIVPARASQVQPDPVVFSWPAAPASRPVTWHR